MAHPMSEPWSIWHPIETAPKDGQHLMLGMADEQYVAEGYYDEAADAWFPPLQSDTDMPDMRIYPTHWMPLPAPPSRANQGAGR